MKSIFQLVLFGGLLIAAACSGEQGQTATKDTRNPATNQEKPDPRYGYDSEAAGELLKKWVDSTALTQDFPKIDGKKTAPELYAFYQNRNFGPAWGVGSSQELLNVIGQLDGEGLNSGDFPLDELRALADSAQSQTATAETGARLDLLLSASYLKLAHLLATGKIKADQLSKEWHIKDEAPDTLVAQLRQAVSGRVGPSLAALRPGFGQYGKLRRHLATYRKLVQQGGWDAVEDGPDLTPGDSSERVTAIRRRLHATGDLAEPPARWLQPARYDSSLIAAVNRYQRRHGLAMEAEITDRMVQSMNVPAEARLKALDFDRADALHLRHGERAGVPPARSGQGGGNQGHASGSRESDECHTGV